MRTLVFSAFSLFALNTFSAIPIDGWYGSVFGGYTDLPDNLWVLHNSVFRSNSRYDGGFHAGGNIGFQSHPMRYELEVTYLQNGIHHFNIDGVKQTAVRGNTSATLGMGNAFYDFEEWIPTIAPWLGAGVGYGFIDGTFIGLQPYATTYYRAEDSVLAWQAMTGLNFNFAENCSLSIGYRYVITTKGNEFGRIFQANLATAGVTYRFNDGFYK